MSLREIKKQKTAKEFMEAIKRIVDKQPECKELRQKIKSGKLLKLNPTNVEKEAGKAYGSTRHHASVLREIERINDHNVAKESIYSQGVIGLKVKNKEKNKEIKALKEKLRGKEAEVEMLKRVNLNLHAHCLELTSALFDMLPQEDKKDLFERQIAMKSDNVTSFNRDK